MEKEKYLVQVADLVAKLAHEDQVDQGGKPYIDHPRRVASFFNNPMEKIIALLHDVLEDSDLEPEDLRPVFGDFITEQVQILTHRPGEDYQAYIERVSQDPLASRIKIADLTHNMDLDRLPMVRERDLVRRKKYERAKAYLLEKWSGEDLWKEENKKSE